MYLIVLQLHGPGTDFPDPARLTETLASLTESGDRVEHLRVLCGPGRIDLAVFLLATSARTAEVVARALCLRALALPELLLWQLTTSGVVDPNLSDLS
ncbi:hypothetical protein ACFW1A_10135 [Kitasatospora sp. NPDC058965]|uniref:hypothetical protein n=1 Tax=Kitasatospora sp. NPDC058965 TaxID=3346682 RepID=UPI0036D14438